MFTSARLKLTAWYLAIIMFISLSFSLFIYQILSMEIYRFARTQRYRIDRRYDEILSPPPFDIELINEAKHRLIMTLITINSSILAISGTVGYFLAGRTLDPIQQMVEEQNRFISDSSHELRTPLTALKSSLEVNLRDKKLTLVEAKKLMSENIEDVNHLQLLSDNLLKLTQYQSSNSSQIFEKITLDSIITSALAKVQPLAKSKRQIIKYTKNNSLIFGDKNSLIELFVILLDNAIKYSHNKGNIIINIESKSKQLLVSIQDNGVGISPADLPHIFDRFYRSDTSRAKTDISGFGLGLSIAKKIVDNHHGTIKVASQLGHGSVFTVAFQPAKLN